ncbi:MAG: DUF2752 domain-containing protein [Lachnospiraceae bacterium]|nr:DUF2752 domain-containing protein [Lachnospiraceae bacterium]
MDRTIRKYGKTADLVAAAAIIAVYAMMEGMGVTCPILFITGVSCAGCGMSRAWLSLLRLDISAAFSYHPLFWLPVPALFVFLFRRRIPARLYRLLICIAALLFLSVYFIRICDPADSVVVFRPKQGLFWRLLAVFRA